MASSIRTSAFTLVELSIVLVIIGLIVGGVLVGRDLIHSSQVRHVASDVEEVQAAYLQFKSRYGYPPGDFPKASTIWPGAINGSGSYLIDWGCGSYERTEAWNHMVDAGLLPPRYTVKAQAICATYDLVDGVNTVTSKLEGVYYMIYRGGGYFSTPLNGNEMRIGTMGPWDDMRGPGMTPADAYDIDLKIDDGKAGSGRLLGPTGTPNILSCDPSPYNVTPGSRYYLANPNKDCFLIYKLD